METRQLQVKNCGRVCCTFKIVSYRLVDRYRDRSRWARLITAVDCNCLVVHQSYCRAVSRPTAGLPADSTGSPAARSRARSRTDRAQFLMKSLEALRWPGPSALPRARSDRVRSTGPVTPPLSVLVAPRDDNPCQELLYLHWVFQYSLPWARSRRWARRAVQWWFLLYLRVASALGYALVWTAHDLLPHERVFADDEQARGYLLARADLIIALASVSAQQLSTLGARRAPDNPLRAIRQPSPRRRIARASPPLFRSGARRLRCAAFGQHRSLQRS